MTDEFYVMAPRNLQEEVVLGKGWMYKHNLYILGTPTLLSRPVEQHETMHPPLIVDKKCTIPEIPSSPNPKSFGLDDKCSGKGTTIVGSPEACEPNSYQNLTEAHRKILPTTEQFTTTGAKDRPQSQQQTFQPKYPSQIDQKR